MLQKKEENAREHGREEETKPYKAKARARARFHFSVGRIYICGEQNARGRLLRELPGAYMCAKKGNKREKERADMKLVGELEFLPGKLVFFVPWIFAICFHGYTLFIGV